MRRLCVCVIRTTGRVVGEVDVVFTAAETQRLEWVRRMMSRGLEEGWFEVSFMRYHPANTWEPLLTGTVDQDDVLFAVALQGIEREGSSIFSRDILSRIFSAASPTYKMTCGRWVDQPTPDAH